MAGIDQKTKNVIKMFILAGLLVLATADNPLISLARYALVGVLLIPLVIGFIELAGSFVGKKLGYLARTNAKISYILYAWPLIIVAGQFFPEALGVGAVEIILLSISFLTSVFFLVAGFEDIAKSVTKDQSPGRHFYRFTISLFLVITTFALIYTELYKINPGSFDGHISDGGTELSMVLNFFYFSVSTFATVGFGDISPLTTVARLSVTLEMLTAFGFVVYLLSNTEQLRELFRDNKEELPREEDKKPGITNNQEETPPDCQDVL